MVQYEPVVNQTSAAAEKLEEMLERVLPMCEEALLANQTLNMMTYEVRPPAHCVCACVCACACVCVRACVRVCVSVRARPLASVPTADWCVLRYPSLSLRYPPL